MASTAARAYLCVGLGAIALHFLLGGSDVHVYDAIGLVSTAVILGETARRRPPTWPAWTAIGLSQLLMSIGDLIYDNLTDRYPGPADCFYLGGAVLLIVGVLLLVTANERRNFVGHVDAALVIVGIGIGAWTLAFNGAGLEGSLVERAVSVAYPLADLLLLGVLARLALIQGRRTASFWLVGGGVVTLFIADSAWVMPALENTYPQGSGWPDAGWLLSYVLLAVAALDRSMDQPVERDSGSSARNPLSLRRILTIGSALVVAPICVVTAEVWHHDVNVVLVGSAGTALLALVVLRFTVIVRELELLRAQAVESERKFRLVFERAPIGISIGREGVMQETNPALQRMLGYTHAELSSKHYTEVTHNDDQDLAVQHELDANEREYFTIDKRYVRKDGSSVDTYVHVALDVEDGLGISIIEDVTTRHELEAQLRQAQKMEAIGKLAGGIAHDFNNLMTAVIGYSDLLLGAFDGDDARRTKVDAIRESAVRASDLTAQLLAFGRRQVLQAAEVDVRDVVQRMDSLLRRLIGEDIRLETLFGAEPVIVRADVTRLEQVVVNLVVNARDAMPGGGRLVVAVISDGADAVLSVVDDGAGMSEDVQSRIFEPFFTTKGVGEGSGLGLSTVHGIVGQSGGSIQVDSAPGEGTCFSVRLPLSPAALPVEPHPATLVD